MENNLNILERISEQEILNAKKEFLILEADLPCAPYAE